MGSSGFIEGLMLETHNFGKTVAFWQQLGWNLVFETDHHSGRLEHSDGGPWLFVAEIEPDRAPELLPIIHVEDADSFEPPAAGSVDQEFVAQHWNVLEMLLRDPDGRRHSVQVPTRESAS